MKRVSGQKKRWKWMLGITSLFLIVFISVFALYMGDRVKADDPIGRVVTGGGVTLTDNATYNMRMNSEALAYVNNTTGSASNYTYHWQIIQPGIVSFNPSNEVLDINNNTNDNVMLYAKALGQTPIQVTVTDNTGAVVYSINFILVVDISINESINSGAATPVMTRINADDERRSLILESGDSVQIGTSAATDTNMINLNLGSAKDATWSTGDSSILSVTNDSSGKQGNIVAVGAGRTTLTAEYSYNGQQGSDTITVYVKPKFTDSNGRPINSTDGLEAHNGDRITASVVSSASSVGLADKLDWVISKSVNGQDTLVRDSLGNFTEEFKDEARLEVVSATEYRIVAKAGEYSVHFFVKGMYTGDYEKFRDERRLPPDGVASFELLQSAFGMKVFSNFYSRDININLGGTLNLSDLLNINANTLQNTGNFDVRILSGSVASTGSSVGSGTGNYIGWLNNDRASMIVGTKGDLGTDTIRVEVGENVSGIPGINPHDVILIRVTVVNRLTLNISDLKLAVGETRELTGVFDYSEMEIDPSQFEWTSTDTNSEFVKMEPITDGLVKGQTISVTGVKTTSEGSPVIVTLKWTSFEGITLVADCRIIVSASATDFRINEAPVTMLAGDTKMLTINGKIDVVWISSDTSVATVVDSSGNNTTAAQLSGLKAGTTVITAFNKANDSYATCLVTVEQPITSLEIGVAGTAVQEYEATMADGYVFFEPLYEPPDATQLDFVWASSDTTIATIDETGKATLLKEGDTWITLSNRNGATQFTTQCLLSIVNKPITSITPDVTELDMIMGDTYTVTTEIAPQNATDVTLVWTSMDPAVARVDGGRITATGVGNTYINVEAQLPQADGSRASATIKVTVRNRLTSIAFDSNTTYINVGGTKQMNVIFTPDQDVNKNLTFRSSDTSIFTVDEKGVITGVKVGQAILTCVAEDLGESGVISCIVHVTASVVTATDFVITPAEGTVYVGGTLQLEKTFTPQDATNQFVTWSSSDTSLATVNNAGVVTGVAEGKVTVSAVYTDTVDNIPWIRTSTINVETAPVHATDFDVNPNSQNIIVGEKFQLEPVFVPANTTDKTVEYQSLDEGVVTVDEKGVVTGVGAGDAVIQCQSVDGGFIATCTVHVDNAIKFSLNPATREIALGKSFSIKKVTDPANANKTAKWTSSNSSIASVSSSGKVTGKRLGSCTITCTLTKYNQSARCRVKVAKLNSRVSLDKKNIRIGVGQTYRLNKTVWSNNTSLPKVTWKSSNKRVVTVNSNGKLTGKKVGLAKITVTTKDAIRAKATCKVRVIQRVTSISLSSDYQVIYVGRSKNLKVKYRPANATIPKVKWESGDENIVRVTASGKMRGISQGDTYVTATTTDGSNKKARCYVKVLDAVPTTSIVVAQTELTMQRGDTANLSYRVLPDNTSDDLKFASDNKRVAKVNNKGKITAVGTGNATVTILATSGVSATVDVNVVALNKTSLNIRQYDTETLVVHGTTEPITWYSANQRIATVENGKVVGRAIGSTYVYAYVEGCRLSCLVTVTSVNS